MAMSPADMDWLSGRKMAQRDICAVYNVPPEMIGDSENKTYSTYQEARVAFYQETVLPLMDWLAAELNHWLLPRYGESDLVLEYDKEGIEALQEDRDALWARADHWWLTPNEKRNMVGLSDIEGGDTLLVPSDLLPLDAALGGGDFPREP
jgi:phage portal protein BeeE